MRNLQVMVPAPSPFRIYNASAGSGKTYTLAREYLSLLLAPGAGQAFREMLAITFTNKAVSELKQRILGQLKVFSETRAEDAPSDLFRDVQLQLGLEREALRQRADTVLQEVLHNYAFFDISTIDRFNHRILRTFSQDLQLPAHFEVELDTDALLARAVDALIQRTGEDAALTHALIEFALEKSAEDKSWDIGRDLMEMGRMLFNENHFRYLDSLGQKNIADYRALRQALKAQQAACEAELGATARGVLEHLDELGLEFGDFSGQYFPKFLQRIRDRNFDVNTQAKWLLEFAEKDPFPKRVDAQTQSLMRVHLPAWASALNTLLELLPQRAFLENADANMAPFTVLGMLQAELQRLQEAEGLLPVARFNAIIAREIAGQPAPYIYERLGEKFRHYFIDEFQDTSELQWQNLIPLIGNALESVDEGGKQGSLILVGDAKQAIYRWRGGRAEQFIGLSRGPGNPFSVPPETITLPRNFRSRDTLVHFNNTFFAQHGNQLSHPEYRELFASQSRQTAHNQDAGLVHLEFLDPEVPEVETAYVDRTLELIRQLLDSGYTPGDICVLTRKRQEGVAVSNRLMQGEIPIISSETLLLRNHPGVGFLIHLLQHLLEPEDPNPVFDLLCYLLRERKDAHSAMLEGLSRPAKIWETLGFNASEAAMRSVYDILEEAIGKFDLGGNGDAYLVALLDLAQEISRKQDSSLATFLRYWEAKADTLSIAAPEGRDAVRLMTIHKAKGLEFPVVIYPFADTQIYKEQRPRIWLPVDPEAFAGFPFLQVSKKKEMEHYGPVAREAYRQEQERLELDAFNVLYVAQTRAAEAMFILTRLRSDSEKESLTDYGALYRGYLQAGGQWDPEQRVYTFGKLAPGRHPKGRQEEETLPLAYSEGDRKNLQLVTASARLWETERESRLNMGNLIHLGLSLVTTVSDIGGAVSEMVTEGYVPAEEQVNLTRILERVVTHPELQAYFKAGLQVYCERDIITENGLILRPDRVVLRPEEVVVIDYKTGRPAAGHREQLAGYARALEQMGHRNVRGILAYISETEILIDIP
ncbi:UvrD-helicase domain-containing protein [Robiginitalea sp. M366]|uniref:UvrD-helicase domain-containing protein n=1 Tax=Robiginitalea aestuariiviva TaxID=3036903 RepID=UPI00240D3C00|nr:UvrD-helicase domain-containing protein [Robiginitalea aestuariiviva]MDG1571601.1 UvrD-helicase domain-containing protein [Robiginitalea aestuariiviva]